MVFLISLSIKTKALVPHEIIHVELVVSPLVLEALTRSISFVHIVWDLSRHRYA